MFQGYVGFPLEVWFGCFIPEDETLPIKNNTVDGSEIRRENHRLDV